MDMNRSGQEWIRICALDDITPDTGVRALVNGAQVALFHVMGTGEISAIGTSIRIRRPQYCRAG